MADKTADTTPTPDESVNAAEDAIAVANAEEATAEEPKAAQEQEPTEETSDDLVDPDDAELEQLRTEAKATNADDAGDGEGDAIAEPKPEPAPEEPSKAEEIKDDVSGNAKPSVSPMVPKARLDEVLDRNRKAEQDAAYWKGVADARTVEKGTSKGDGQQSATQEPSPQDRVNALNAEIDKAWESADDGDLSLSEARKKEREIQNQIAEIVQQTNTAARPDNQQNTTGRDSEDLYLAERTETLAKAHPYVDEIKSDADWDFLRGKAIDALRSNGADLTSGPLADLKLREKMAELTDQYGPLMTGKPLATPGNQPAPTTTPETGGISQTAKDRAAKLAVAAQQPPLTGELGGSGVKAQMTEADIMNMSEDDIGALPEATRRAFLPSI